VNIPIPSHTAVFIGDPDAPSIFLTGLSQSLTPAQHVRVTFTFQKAGQVTLDVTVSGPNQAKARSSTFNFEEPSATTPGSE
jgi:copper(I)-binding protein